MNTSRPGSLLIEFISSDAAPAYIEFGIGSPDLDSTLDDREFALIRDGVDLITPTTANMGYYPAEAEIDFYMITEFGGVFWAFSSNLGDEPTSSDLVTFTDIDNSLGFGGSIVEELGPDDWILHMDDPASICCDDDDNDFVVRIRVIDSLLVTTQPGDLIIEFVSSDAGSAYIEFGLGTPDKDSTLDERDFALIRDGVDLITPRVVNMGHYPTGSELDFYMLSEFGGFFWAFSGSLFTEPTDSDLVTFTDTDDSLEMGGSILKKLGIDDWSFHMDDPASICCDDDDNDFVVRISVVEAEVFADGFESGDTFAWSSTFP